MRNLAIGLLLGLTCVITGCVPIIMGVAAGGGAYYVSQKHFKKFYNDNDINNMAFAKLRRDPSLRHARILAATKNRVLLLVGEVTNPAQRIEAEQLMHTIPGVRRIYNAISISGPISLLTQSSDDWITTKIKGDIAITKGLPTQRIKVVTENGVVYLMGNVTPRQGTIATTIARRTAGVRKVVNLFEYI